MPANTKSSDDPFLLKRGFITREGALCTCTFDDDSSIRIPLNNLRYHYKHGDTVEWFSVWYDSNPEISHLITVQGMNYLLMCLCEETSNGFRIDSSVEYPKYQ